MIGVQLTGVALAVRQIVGDGSSLKVDGFDLVVDGFPVIVSGG
jgi:hypothetical protein